jgi:hypothetical protein
MSEIVDARRAIEALRTGVPNGTAVRQLGVEEGGPLRAFDTLLSSVASRTSGASPPGLLIAGGFGSGKSHMLTYMLQEALGRGFAVSPVAVSKEAILGDPSKVLAAAIAGLRVPGRAGTGLRNLTEQLGTESAGTSRLSEWADPATSGIPSSFAASLYLFRQGKDQEFNDQIVQFWAGGRLPVTELRRRLRDVQQAAACPVSALPPAREMALHRFRFISQLVAAAGYAGWILLIDEVELIGLYSALQRARAYGELARWLGRLGPADSIEGVGAVAAITNDFVASVLDSKNDRELIPGRLGASHRSGDALLAEWARLGMSAIERDAVRVLRPGREAIERTRRQLLAIYRVAYSLEEAWPPGGLDPLPPVAATDAMRHLIRSWIADWDLRRLYPGFSPEITITPVDLGGMEDDEDLTREPAEQTE